LARCAATPNRSKLLGRLVEVLIFGSHELANLEAYSAYWSEKETDGLLRRVDKITAEALLLAYLASRVPQGGRRLANAVEALCESAQIHIATGRSEALIRRFPQTAATLGVGFVLLSKLGRRQPTVERLLRSALSRGFLTLTERSTFRLMDGRWTYGLLEPNLAQPVEELFPLTTLAASPHPIYTMNEDDYALTHALFYLTDFGQRPPLLALQQRGAQLIDPYLAWNAIRANLDLLVEFLISALVMRRHPSPAFRFAWHLLFQAWDDCQGLVGPEYSSTHFAELNRSEAAAYAFSENYHTAFVGGMLCSVALTAVRPDSWVEPPASSAVTELAARCRDAASRAYVHLNIVAPHCVDVPVLVDELPEWISSRLLTVLQTSPDPAPPWLRTAIDCDLSREELASVLYDGLLVAAARNYQLVQLAEALAVGARHEALHSSTFTRALEFLLDQQLMDGFVGIHRLLANERDLALLAEAQEVLAGFLARIGKSLHK
jgi:hypothetical protein